MAAQQCQPGLQQGFPPWVFEKCLSLVKIILIILKGAASLWRFSENKSRRPGNRGWITSSLFETKGHKVRLQGEREGERKGKSWTSMFSALSAALAVGLFESAVQSAALRDLSIHLLWPRSNAPNNTPFLFYSTSLSLCWVAQQNYVPNDNYQSKLWSKKWRQRKLLTRTSSRNRTPKRSSVITEERGERKQGDREDLHLCGLSCDDFSQLIVTNFKPFEEQTVSTKWSVHNPCQSTKKGI